MPLDVHRPGTSRGPSCLRAGDHSCGTAIRSPVLKTEIKDKDLIQFVAKAMDIMQKATAQSKVEEIEDKSGVTNIFNILDQSIQENIRNIPKRVLKEQRVKRETIIKDKQGN